MAEELTGRQGARVLRAGPVAWLLPAAIGLFSLGGFACLAAFWPEGRLLSGSFGVVFLIVALGVWLFIRREVVFVGEDWVEVHSLLTMPIRIAFDDVLELRGTVEHVSLTNVAITVGAGLVAAGLSSLVAGGAGLFALVLTITVGVSQMVPAFADVLLVATRGRIVNLRGWVAGMAEVIGDIQRHIDARAEAGDANPARTAE
tara:strand:+ start:41 stop:646 length:606 start_codon:yes stop_codon:yes gene_type:complete